MPKPPLVIVAGPTASGKSSLALDAAVEFGGTVINADSMQVYRELRVLTARPSPQAEARAPHKLFGILSATERCSAGRWLELAIPEIEAAWRARSLPIVVGGTGLYLKALLEGLSPVPTIPEAIRSEARELLARLGGDGMRAELARLDPETAARLPAADGQRLTRAYEVARATGKSLSRWQADEKPRPPLQAETLTLALLPPRDDLYATIDARLERMLEEGALAEVAAVRALGLDPALPAARAVGLREFGRYLDGDIDREAALHAAQQSSRNYAKRQFTWLRKQIAISEALSEKYSERVEPIIFSFIRKLLLTAQF
jgi:tRNA dimethylallyltransferase